LQNSSREFIPSIPKLPGASKFSSKALLGHALRRKKTDEKTLRNVGSVQIMKSLLVGVSCAAVLLMSGATSIDMARAGDANWSGFYAGGQVGYGFGVPNTEFLDVEGEPGTEIEKIYDITPNRGPNGTADCATGSTIACTYARDGEFSGGVGIDASGFNGGVHVGYNFQPSNVVFGIEGDYDWSGMDGSGDGLITPKAGTLRPGQTLDDSDQFLRVNSEFDYLASSRGRLGITSGAFLLYGTVGVAWTGQRECYLA